MKYWYMIYTDYCVTCGHITTYRVRMYGNPPQAGYDELKYVTREVHCDKHKHMYKHDLYAQR